MNKFNHYAKKKKSRQIEIVKRAKKKHPSWLFEEKTSNKNKKNKITVNQNDLFTINVFKKVEYKLTPHKDWFKLVYQSTSYHYHIIPLKNGLKSFILVSNENLLKTKILEDKPLELQLSFKKLLYHLKDKEFLLIENVFYNEMRPVRFSHEHELTALITKNIRKLNSLNQRGFSTEYKLSSNRFQKMRNKIRNNIHCYSGMRRTSKNKTNLNNITTKIKRDINALNDTTKLWDTNAGDTETNKILWLSEQIEANSEQWEYIY